MKKQFDLFDNNIDKEFVKIKVWRNDLVELHFDDYLVNRLGQIWSVKKNALVSVCLNNHIGYYYANIKNKTTISETNYLRNNKKYGHKKFHIHRIVACTFLNNPDRNIYRIVHHIDNNKQNNKLENLEWTTASKNSLYYHKLKNKNQLILF